MCGNYISIDNPIFSDDKLKDKLKKICKKFVEYEKDELYRIKAWFSIIEIHQDKEENPKLTIYMNTSPEFGDEGIYNINFHQDIDSVICTYEHGNFYSDPNPEYNGFEEFIKENPEHNYVTCNSRKGNYVAKIFTEEQFIDIVNEQIVNLDFKSFSVGEILGLEPLTKSDFSRNIDIQTRGGFTGWNWNSLE
jgi:hypothetical protein